MKVIVVRQPWAWLIVHGFKDIENRSWATRYRGTLLVQASAGLPTKHDLEEARVFARKRGVELPEDFERGGIVGMVRLEDCVTRSRSKWFEGPVGWVLSGAKRLPFIPLKGQLGLFDPPQEIVRQLGREGSSQRNASLPGKPAAEVVPIVTLARQNLRHIKPRIGSGRFLFQFLHAEAGLGDDCPEISETLFLGLLVGLLSLASPVVGIADIGPAFDFDGHLVTQLPFKFLLDADVRVGAESENHLALGCVHDRDFPGVPGDDEGLDDFCHRDENIERRFFADGVIVAAIELRAEREQG